MSKRLFYAANQSYTATATNTQLAASTFMGLQGGNTTQIFDILEILISGGSAASTVTGFVIAPSSVAATTPTALAAPNADGLANPSGTSLSTAVATFVTATTRPTNYAAATVPVLNLSINSFGGIIRWNAAPTQQLTSVGNAANLGSWSMFNSSSSGGATASANAHILYEPY